MMGAITRSGSEIARRYLIHGARATLRYEAQADPMLMWAEKTVVRIGKNKGTVALAHRLSRVCFAMMRDQTDYPWSKKEETNEKSGLDVAKIGAKYFKRGVSPVMQARTFSKKIDNLSVARKWDVNSMGRSRDKKRSCKTTPIPVSPHSAAHHRPVKECDDASGPSSGHFERSRIAERFQCTRHWNYETYWKNCYILLI
jgi:hypothetical protein